MRKLIFISCLLLFLPSCTKYRSGDAVKIKLGGHRGIVVCNHYNNTYDVRYMDKNGVYQTSNFGEDELAVIPGETIIRPDNIFEIWK